MNCKKINLIVSGLFLLSWISLFVILALFANLGGEAVTTLVGTAMLGLWVGHILGIGTAVVNLVQEVRGWTGWLALLSHFFQLVATVLLTLIGIVIGHQAGEL